MISSNKVSYFNSYLLALTFKKTTFFLCLKPVCSPSGHTQTNGHTARPIIPVVQCYFTKNGDKKTQPNKQTKKTDL